MKRVIPTTAFLLTLVVAQSFAASHASAATKAYTSYGPKMQYFTTGPTAAGTAAERPDYLPAGYIVLAAQFTPKVSGSLDHLDLALTTFSGLGGATITITSDNGSGAPSLTGPVIDTLIATKIPYSSSSAPSTQVKSIAKPNLTAGTTYWIILTPIAYDEELFWFQSPHMKSSVIYSSDGGQTFKGYTGSQTAFDVFVNTTQ